MPVLICFSGLPGVGKTTISKALTQHFPSTYLRVDVVEAALRESVLKIDPCEDAGYLAICAIAKSNLKLGNNVIADTVNPLQVTRDLWASAAREADATLFNIEIVCSDPNVHQRRVETRAADIDNFPLPDWHRVVNREYHPWERPDLRLDSAALNVDACVAAILSCLTKKPRKS